jgi:hypothetical protein
MLRAADKALARGLKVELLPGALAEVGEGRLEPVTDALRSEAADMVLGPIGTIRF